MITADPWLPGCRLKASSPKPLGPFFVTEPDLPPTGLDGRQAIAQTVLNPLVWSWLSHKSEGQPESLAQPFLSTQLSMSDSTGPVWSWTSMGPGSASDSSRRELWFASRSASQLLAGQGRSSCHLFPQSLLVGFCGGTEIDVWQASLLWLLPGRSRETIKISFVAPRRRAQTLVEWAGITGSNVSGSLWASVGSKE